MASEPKNEMSGQCLSELLYPEETPEQRAEKDRLYREKIKTRLFAGSILLLGAGFYTEAFGDSLILGAPLMFLIWPVGALFFPIAYAFAGEIFLLPALLLSGSIPFLYIQMKKRTQCPWASYFAIPSLILMPVLWSEMLMRVTNGPFFQIAYGYVPRSAEIVAWCPRVLPILAAAKFGTALLMDYRGKKESMAMLSCFFINAVLFFGAIGIYVFRYEDGSLLHDDPKDFLTLLLMLSAFLSVLAETFLLDLRTGRRAGNIVTAAGSNMVFFSALSFLSVLLPSFMP